MCLWIVAFASGEGIVAIARLPKHFPDRIMVLLRSTPAIYVNIVLQALKHNQHQFSTD